MSTAQIAGPISGEKLYQKRARRAFPLLVRQARARVPIFYSDLAEELGMPNPRNLNYVLGSIGQCLEGLSKQWKEPIPPLQCVVVNKDTNVPGDGIGWFLMKRADFSAFPMRQKRKIVATALHQVFSYPRWEEVLDALSLERTSADFSALVSKASKPLGKGETEGHRLLKEYVAQNPQAIGLKAATPVGRTEDRLPSGDSLDVSFDCKGTWVAAEVKSMASPGPDVIRGLFQCLKYRAVMEAVLRSRESSREARVLLVLEGSFPKSLVSLRNVLGVEVLEGVTPRKQSKRARSRGSTGRAQAEDSDRIAVR